MLFLVPFGTHWTTACLGIANLDNVGILRDQRLLDKSSGYRRMSWNLVQRCSCFKSDVLTRDWLTDSPSTQVASIQTHIFNSSILLGVRSAIARCYLHVHDALTLHSTIHIPPCRSIMITKSSTQVINSSCTRVCRNIASHAQPRAV